VLSDIGFHALVAARHGSRAAELDATPVGHIPRRHSHFRWSVDEAMLPIWAKYFCPELKAYRSFRPWLVVVRDHASSVVVGWFVVNPVGHVRPDVTPRLGFSADDVMAALLTAASRELAPASCRPFAGCTPDRIRWDNHSTHRSLELAWKDRRGSVPDLEFVEAPPVEHVPVRRPINNGAVERTNGVLKHLFRSCPWHVSKVHPVDVENLEVREGSGRARTLHAAGSTERLPRHELVQPDDLPSHAMIVQLVEAAVLRHNNSPFRKSRLTRADEFRRLKLHGGRSGDDLIRLLAPETRTVSREGIRGAHRDGPVLIATENADAHFSVRIPQAVTLHLDPGARGAWARNDAHLVFLRRVDHPMTDPERRAFVINQSARARRASDEAAALTADVPFVRDLITEDESLEELQAGATPPVVSIPRDLLHEVTKEENDDFLTMSRADLAQGALFEQHLREKSV